MNTWREELAWVAGFFDGEGHVAEHKDGPSVRMYLSISQKYDPLLHRVAAAVGFGRILGPYGSKYEKFVFTITNFEHVQAFAAMVWPWLGEAKRAQFRRALTKRRRSQRYMPKAAHCRLCEKPVQARDLCSKHYWQMRQGRGEFAA